LVCDAVRLAEGVIRQLPRRDSLPLRRSWSPGGGARCVAQAAPSSGQRKRPRQNLQADHHRQTHSSFATESLQQRTRRQQTFADLPRVAEQRFGVAALLAGSAPKRRCTSRPQTRIKHKTRRRKGGSYPLSHLYGHFGLVRLSKPGRTRGRPGAGRSSRDGVPRVSGNTDWSLNQLSQAVAGIETAWDRRYFLDENGERQLIGTRRKLPPTRSPGLSEGAFHLANRVTV
jgi:hypothetical protein